MFGARNLPMHARANLLPVVLSSLVFVASGCQQSSGPSSLGTRNTGRLVDPAIAGLTWATPTQTGVTAADGSFQYLAGETVTFSLGPIAIGTAVPATATMSVFDLVPGATPPLGAAAVRRLRQQAGRIAADADLVPVFEASNLLAMLWSFDADKVAGNGIQLATGVDGVLQGLSLDFRQPSLRFHAREHELRIALFRAFGQDLVATARRVTPLQALDRHWAARGLEPQLWTDSRSEYDTGNNGTADSIDTWTVDGRGFRVDHARDDDADGTRDRYESYEFTDDGDLLVRTIDNDGNGTIDSRMTQEFDVHGQLVWRLDDTDGGGLPDRITHHDYDSLGNPVRTEFDYNADGTIDAVVTRAFDDAGNQLRIENDDDANGTPNRIEVRTFDAHHNTLTVLYDGNADGIPEGGERFEYDAAGNPTLRENDWNGDGTADFRAQYTWSAGSDMLVETEDYNADGTADNLVRREYDPQHRATRYERDEGANGSLEEVASFTYVDDAYGNEVLAEHDYGDNGSVNWRQSQSWGAEGQLLAAFTDTNGDTLYDYSETHVQVRTTLLGTILGD